MMGVMAEGLESKLQDQSGTREFGSWMAAEQKRIFLLCRRMLGDPADADAAAQDTFLKAWQGLNRRQEDSGDPDRWLTRIAINTCLDRLRSRKWQFWRKRPNPEDESIMLQMTASPAPDAEDRLFAGQIEKRLALALDKLSARQRSVFALRHYEDLSLAEIAAILELDTGTVKAHLFRALDKLRSELSDLYFFKGGTGAASNRRR